MKHKNNTHFSLSLSLSLSLNRLAVSDWVIVYMSGERGGDGEWGGGGGGGGVSSCVHMPVCESMPMPVSVFLSFYL